MDHCIPRRAENKKIIIAVRKGRSVVARFRQIGSYEFDIEEAPNWETLEVDAVQAVELQIGAIIEDDIFPCPPELAQQAIFRAADVSEGMKCT